MSYVRILKDDLFTIASELLWLKKKGEKYIRLCPFHSEEMPSFTVDKEKQLYHCFGCGEGGDVVTFKKSIQEKIDQFSEPLKVTYFEEKWWKYGKPKIRKVLMLCLTSREKKVLALRFGLYGERRHFLREIGEILGITKGRVQQIEQKAIRKFGRMIIYQQRKEGE